MKGVWRKNRARAVTVEYGPADCANIALRFPSQGGQDAVHSGEIVFLMSAAVPGAGAAVDQAGQKPIVDKLSA